MKLTKLTVDEKIARRKNLGMKWRNEQKKDQIYVEQERLRHRQVNNIGFFPRNKVEILAGVISLGLVEEQKVIRRNCIPMWSYFF